MTCRNNRGPAGPTGSTLAPDVGCSAPKPMNVTASSDSRRHAFMAALARTAAKRLTDAPVTGRRSAGFFSSKDPS